MDSSNLQSPDFERLIEKHSKEIFAYLWRLTQNMQDAEDCLQDTFLRAYKSYPKLKHHDNLRAWLYKIATNVANTHLKKKTLEQHNTTELTHQINNGHQPTPTLIEHKLTIEEVKAAVHKLPKKQQAALFMKKFQGMRYVEIAQALDINEDAARANVYQAMNKLRQQFRIKEENYA